MTLDKLIIASALVYLAYRVLQQRQASAPQAMYADVPAGFVWDETRAQFVRRDSDGRVIESYA